MRLGTFWATCALAALAACGGAEPPELPGPGAGSATRPPTLLVDGSARVGIGVRHRAGGVGHRELPETMGAGAAVFDYDRDGDLDLYLVQSGTVRGAQPTDVEEPSQNALFANDGTGSFTRVKQAAGAADRGYGQGVAIGDFDGDGWDDVLCLNWGPNRLYRNREGEFRDTRSATGLEPFDEWSVGATFFDMDGDGDLDLYVVNYVEAPPGSHVRMGRPQGFDSFPHPDVFLAEPDRLYRNEGDGTFTDVTRAAGVFQPGGKGLSAVPVDVDLDGWLDLYVANDSTPNFLFRNLGQAEPRFVELASRAGVAYNDDGRTEAGMGLDVADVDEDGDFDLFVANLDLETNTLYVNSGSPGKPLFRDRTRAAGLAEPSRMLVGFGALFEDVDADGHLDLLVANGHILDDAASLGDLRSYWQPNQLFLGDGAGRFELASPELAGSTLAVPAASRGSAVGDLDGDGDPDFVITNNDGRPEFHFSTWAERGVSARTLVLELAGPPGNPRGLGAAIWFELADGRRVLRRLESGRSYASSSAPAAYVALTGELAAIEVLWPGGARERWPGTSAAGGRVRLEFGTGTPLGTTLAPGGSVDSGAARAPDR